MLKKLEKMYDEKVISLFYILLPLVEVITTYMIVHMNTSITLGIVYKTLFLLYAIFYLVFINKEKRKSTFVMLGFIVISAVINFIISIDSFSLSSIIVKISEICKYITFPVAMLFLYKYTENGNKIHLKTLVYSASVYATVMIIARLTGTQYATYSTVPEYGHSGWYYSGNEISALLAMFYPIIIYFASKYRSKSMIFALSTVTYGLLAIGTKTSFVAIAITIIGLFIFELFMFITRKNRLSKNMLFTVFILLIVLIASAPYSPSLKYMVERIDIAKNSVTVGEEPVDNKKVLQSFVYNGRELDVQEQVEKYKNASVIEKIFGVNHDNRIKLEDGSYNSIERDLYDIFFVYGIVGIFIYFMPIVLICVSFLERMFKDFKTECNEKNFVMGISICLSLGISYIAGHVLLAPTVALFLSVVLIKLNTKEDSFYIEEKNSKRKVAIFIPRLSIGGMEKSLINLLRMSNLKSKYDIKVYVGYIKDKEYIDDIPKEIDTYVFCKKDWTLKNKIITIFKMIVLNSKFIFENTFYASICYGHNHGVLATLTRNASKNNIIFIHADLASRNEKEMKKLNSQVKFQKFKKVVCVSDKALRSFKEIFPQYNGTSLVINNYIDGDKILKLASDDKEITENIDFEGKITFIHVSRQEEKSKKISRIIESSKKLKDDKYNFQVILVGNGEDSKSYEKMIKESKLEDTIFMVGNKKNPYVYLKKSSALLFTSIYEGYGVVLDEARVLNIPIISTDVADAKNITEKGFGILCENSSEGVYLGMKEFLDKGYNIKEKFDYNKFNNVITNKLNDIIKER